MHFWCYSTVLPSFEGLTKEIIIFRCEIDLYLLSTMCATCTFDSLSFFEIDIKLMKAVLELLEFQTFTAIFALFCEVIAVRKPSVEV